MALPAPKISVRDNGTWKTPVEPKRVWVRRTRKVGNVDVTEWDPVSSLYVRNNGEWSLPKTWSPPTPTGVIVPTDKRDGNAYASTYLQWNPTPGASYYRVRQTQWRPDLSGPAVPPVTAQVVNNAFIFDNIAAGTFYSYEVAAVGANGLESDYTDPYQYKSGVPEAAYYRANYDWADYQGGATNWPTETGLPVWGDVYLANRATNNVGWNENSWGWLLHQQFLLQNTYPGGAAQAITIGGIAPGRIDFVGPRPAFPYNPTIVLRPPQRVLINYYQLGHVCAMGFKNVWNFRAYSRGYGEYQLEHYRANGTLVSTFAGPFGVSGFQSPGDTWIHQPAAWTSQMTCYADVDGTAGDYIICRVLEYPPVTLGTSANPDGTGDGQLPYHIANIRFLWFWWYTYRQVSSTRVVTTNAVAGTTWGSTV